MVVAQIGAEVYPKHYERIGSIRHGGMGFMLKLRGWFFGAFCARPTCPTPPRVEGKLYGRYLNDKGETQSQYAGRIWANDNEHGQVMYSGVLEVQPREWEMLYVSEDT
jgi:hypothetical protein